MAKRKKKDDGRPMLVEDVDEYIEELEALEAYNEAIKDAAGREDWPQLAFALEVAWARHNAVTAWVGQYLHRTQSYCRAANLALPDPVKVEDIL